MTATKTRTQKARRRDILEFGSPSELFGNLPPPFPVEYLGISQQREDDAAFGESKKPGYTDETPSSQPADAPQPGMGDTAENRIIARLRKMSPAKLAALEKLIDDFERANGETTGRAAEETLAAKLAVIEQEARKKVDGTLLELVHRYAELRERIELPADGLKTLDQARSAALLSTTFGNLQARLQKYGLEPLPRDPRVVEARRQSSSFYRRERVEKRSGSALATASPA